MHQHRSGHHDNVSVIWWGDDNDSRFRSCNDNDGTIWRLTCHSASNNRSGNNRAGNYRAANDGTRRDDNDGSCVGWVGSGGTWDCRQSRLAHAAHGLRWRGACRLERIGMAVGRVPAERLLSEQPLTGTRSIASGPSRRRGRCRSLGVRLLPKSGRCRSRWTPRLRLGRSSSIWKPSESAWWSTTSRRSTSKPSVTGDRPARSPSCGGCTSPTPGSGRRSPGRHSTRPLRCTRCGRRCGLAKLRYETRPSGGCHVSHQTPSSSMTMYDGADGPTTTLGLGTATTALAATSPGAKFPIEVSDVVGCKAPVPA